MTGRNPRGILSGVTSMNRSKFILLAVMLIGSVLPIAAQTERERAFELYEAGSYKEAISLLKNITKKNEQDTESLFYLGSAYFKVKKIDDGGKVFKKFVKVKPGGAQGYIGLAYFNLFSNKLAEARVNAGKALELDPKNAEGHYLQGEISFLYGVYNSAYQSAEKAIALNPKYAAPYLLKSNALTRSYMQTYATVTKFPAERVELLKEAAENLEKYVALEKDKSAAERQRSRLGSLRFFIEYYSRPKPIDIVYSKSVEIISKPRPAYTPEARRAQISGTVRLLIEFAHDGTVRHIMVLNGLGGGLTEEAIIAAGGIRFIPAEQNGKPVSVVKAVEFNFLIY